MNGLRPHLIDGVILSPRTLDAQDLQSRRVDTPLVLFSEHLEVPYDRIAIDDVTAGRLATNHLVGLGRRRIAVIGVGEVRPESVQLRLRGYTAALHAAGQPLDPDLVVPITSSYHRGDGAQAMRYLLTLNPPPDAVFCFTDLLALGAISALHEAGRRIPEDVAVIGIDDLEESRFATPSLSTIAPDKEMMGELAVSLLLGRIDGTCTTPPQRYEVPFRLIIRKSTGGSSAFGEGSIHGEVE
jgi:DNA-binding LacI/PurR family transcriptional regulator